MIIPLYRALQNNSHIEMKVLALTTAQPTLESVGIPYLGFLDLLGPEDTSALEMGRKLAAELPSLKNKFEEAAAYLGLCYAELEQTHGKLLAEKLFKEKGRQAFLPIRVIEKLLRKEKPDLVFVTNSPRCEMAAVFGARKIGIPCICLIDLFAMPEVEYIGKAGYADKLLVLSGYAKNILVNAGRKSDEIVITGNPAFDELASAEILQNGAAHKLSMGWGNKKVLLWASQPEPPPHVNLPREIDQALFKLIEKNKDWQLVLRPHPSETLPYVSYPDRVSVSRQSEDLKMVISSSDVVITLTSTVGLQGYLLNKPLIAIELSILNSCAPYADMGLAYGVRELSQLGDTIEKALLLGKLNSNSIPKSGLATRNVVREIMEILGGRV